MNSFINSGAGVVLSIWFILALVLNSKNNFIIARQMIWVQCGVAIMNGLIVQVFTHYRCWLPNHLHGKAAKICLANQLK